MALTQTQVSQLYVSVFGRASEGEGNAYWMNDPASTDMTSTANVMLATEAAQTYFGDTINDNAAFVAFIYTNTLGKSYADDSAGQDYWVAELEAGKTKGEMVAALISAAQAPENAGAAQDQFNNKVAVSDYTADTLAAFTTIEEFTGFISGVDETADSVAAAIAEVNAAAADTLTLTQRADDLTGTVGDDVFTAPVTQNETGSGQLANTFETGDVLDGGEGTDVLRADLIETGSISDTNQSPAISATTTGIENVFLRQQNPQVDIPVNGSTIDAEKMAGVEQWWSDNSRSGIQIEDIRTATADTAFGMRLTDPLVNFNNYFNALFLNGVLDSGASSFSFVIAETGNAAAEIANINVIAIRFDYEGVNYSLDSADVAAADTWADLTTALQADIDAVPALAGLTVSHVGGGIFNVIDNSAGVFTIDPSGTVVTASTVNETKDATPGLIAPEEGPTITDVVLDGAGNGSQGGTLTIGAMSGLRGVEVFNVDVDRNSHLTVMQSTNLIAPNNGDPNEFLQVVNLNSIGAEGDLQIGARTVTPDGRANTAGLVNVREVNGGDFLGDLNLGISLTNNALGRYLDDAADVVEFIYTAAAGDDLFNIADLSGGGIVSGDEDFSMTVDMAAGDDILVINVPTVGAVSVDGGTGENTIKVAQSHGVNAGNTFAEFANFQTYEVEGNVALTQHNFASMPGVEEVVIATFGTVSTQLVNLEADQNVTISGKNQTFLPNTSTNDQNFNVITLTNDAGVERTVTLENTARLSNETNGVRQDGVLTVNQLVINENVLPLFPGTSATTDLTVDSAGARNVANAVTAFNGRDVETLDFIGTQDLTFNVAQIADQAAAAGVTASTALDIDASALEGELNLAMSGTMIGNWGSAINLTDRITGTEGDNDTLMVYGVQGGTAPVVTDFETLQFGSAGTTMFGDWAPALTASGTFNAQSVDVQHIIVADNAGTLTLENLGSGVTIDLGDANRDAAGARVLNQNIPAIEQLNIVSSAANAAATVGEVNINILDVIGTGYFSNISIGDDVAGIANGVGGYRTIALDVARDANLAALLTPNVSDINTIELATGSQARTLNVTGGQEGRSNVTAAAQEVQIIDFEGLTNTVAGGTFTIGGILVTLPGGAENPAAIAVIAQAAIIAAGTPTNATLPVAAIVSGSQVAITYDAVDGDVAAIDVVDGTASFVGGVTAATTATVIDDRVPVAAVGTDQLADVLDFTNGGAFTTDLSLGLEVIDLGDYSGQVSLRMEQGVAAGDQTDVSFQMNGYDTNITLSNGTGLAADATDVTHNSVFYFTEAGTVANPTVWTINNFVAADLVSGNGIEANTTLLDLTALNISNYAEVDIVANGYAFDGVTALGAGTFAIRSESQANDNAETWEILVTGVEGIAAIGEISADNFLF